MSESLPELSPRALSRLAGVLYLIIIVFGISGEVALRGSLLVPGDVGATSANIIASPGRFRAAFVVDTIMLLADVGLAVTLYLLFKPISGALSAAAAVFRLAQAAVIGANLLNYHMAGLLLGGSAYSAALDPAGARALAAVFLDLHAHGYDLGLIFFGFGNLLLGYLALRATRLPSWLGVALLGAGLVYLVGSYLRFLAPQWQPVFQPAYGIPLVAELAFCLWLLFRGIRN